MSADKPLVFADGFPRRVAVLATRLVEEARREVLATGDPKVGIAATAQAFVIVARMAGLDDAQLVRFVADVAPITTASHPDQA
jgi:hypothetical protein